jgi:uncharacterized membrane protein
MNSRSAIALFIIVALGALAALCVWSLIVKNQLSSATSGNSTLGTLASLIGINKNS